MSLIECFIDFLRIFSINLGPSYHQCPNNSASKGAINKGSKDDDKERFFNCIDLDKRY